MQKGDLVIYRVSKFSTSPGRRARNVRPNVKGETYSYQVDKFWVVVDSQQDGTLVVATRRGKQHVVAASDIRLRQARWWERWLFADRFPELPTSPAG
jgi:hypothetical protein